MLRKIKFSTALRKRIEESRSDYGALSSALANPGIPHGSDISCPQERLVDKVLAKQEEFAKALDELFALEDMLSEAINTLTADEQYIIIEAYMSGKPDWKIGAEMGYSDRAIRYKRKTAIEKISKV